MKRRSRGDQGKDRWCKGGMDVVQLTNKPHSLQARKTGSVHVLPNAIRGNRVMDGAWDVERVGSRVGMQEQADFSPIDSLPFPATSCRLCCAIVISARGGCTQSCADDHSPPHVTVPIRDLSLGGSVSCNYDFFSPTDRDWLPWPLLCR